MGGGCVVVELKAENISKIIVTLPVSIVIGNERITGFLNGTLDADDVTTVITNKKEKIKIED